MLLWSSMNYVSLLASPHPEASLFKQHANSGWEQQIVLMPLSRSGSLKKNIQLAIVSVIQGTVASLLHVFKSKEPHTILCLTITSHSQ